MKVVVSLKKKDIDRLPRPVRRALLMWVRAVREDGLAATRMLPGNHDEPLKGKLKGKRSVRLNRGWRAVYVEHKDGSVYVEVVEVSNQPYRH